ncbi:MAG: hypothetical protein JXA50_10860 [Deltaproteobacteria bacterium]|nr:hypothetical protein [Deltaproteobacteria bacterium]
MSLWKGCYRCVVTSIVLLSLVSLAWGMAPQKLDKPSITNAAIGKKDLTNATDVTIIKEDLTSNGEILIVGTADGAGSQVKKVEVSLDGGKTWEKATGHESWQFRFVPLPNKSYQLIFRVTNSAGLISAPKAFGIKRLTYLPITLWELIQQQADKLAKAYMSRRLEQYMELISKDYQQYPKGWQGLRRTIDNDFKTLNNIVLRFTVDQVYELEGVIMAEMHWRLTYAGLVIPEEGYAEIHFDPTDQLKIVLQEKDRYFGTAARMRP